MDNEELELFEESEPEPIKIMIHCKPNYAFQSLEFDYEVEDTEDIDRMFELYEKLVNKLKEIAPEQPVNGKPVVKEELATEKQLLILKKFGIQHSKDITKKEASKLIQLSMGD